MTNHLQGLGCLLHLMMRCAFEQLPPPWDAGTIIFHNHWGQMWLKPLVKSRSGLFQKIDPGSCLRTIGLLPKLDVDPAVPELDVLADRISVVANQASRNPILSDRTDTLLFRQCSNLFSTDNGESHKTLIENTWRVVESFDEPLTILV